MASDWRSASQVCLVEVRVGVGQVRRSSSCGSRRLRRLDVGAADVAEELLILDLDAFPTVGFRRRRRTRRSIRWWGRHWPSSGTVKMPGNSRCQWKKRYCRASRRSVVTTLSGTDSGFSDRLRSVAWVMPWPEVCGPRSSVGRTPRTRRRRRVWRPSGRGPLPGGAMHRHGHAVRARSATVPVSASRAALCELAGLNVEGFGPEVQCRAGLRRLGVRPCCGP